MPARNPNAKEAHRNKPSTVERIAIFDNLPESALIGTRELCALINVSRATLFRMIRSGQIPKPIKLGQRDNWTAATVRSIQHELLQAA